MSSRPLDDLAARFAACTVPAAEWTHMAHLRVGLWHVRRYGAADALDRLRAGIRRLNESHGNTNTETSGYHETITVAYVQLLATFLDTCADALLAGPLGERTVLLTYWSKELLMSTEARTGWVPPDLAPLALPTLMLPSTPTALAR
jgi:hypothetical protein